MQSVDYQFILKYQTNIVQNNINNINKYVHMRMLIVTITNLERQLKKIFKAQPT